MSVLFMLYLFDCIELVSEEVTPDDELPEELDSQDYYFLLSSFYTTDEELLLETSASIDFITTGILYLSELLDPESDISAVLSD